MCKTSKLLVAAVLFAAVDLSAGAQAGATRGSAVHVWERQEITLKAQRTYSNPYVSVDVWVDLTGPGFSKRVYGFWDGEETYRVRIVATALGEWTWKSGWNPDDPGLSGKSGRFRVVAWSDAEKEANPNRRGFIRATPNGHALQYADGTLLPGG